MAKKPPGIGGGYLLGLGLATFLALCVMTLVAPALNHDNAAYLEYGRRLVDGGLPYVDFIDTNPPLIIYLNALPALLEAHLGIPIVTAFRFCVALISLLCALLARDLLRRNCAEPILAETLFWFLLSSVLVFSGDYDFGQRDHLAGILYVPLLFARWSRSNGVSVPTSVASLAGGMAGVGACIKPHFVIVVASIEAFRLLRHRDLRTLLRPEAVMFLLPGLVYALHLATAPEPMRQAMFGRWLPILLEHYSVYDQPMAAAFRSLDFWCYGVIAGMALVVVRSSKSSRLDELLRTFALFTLLSLAIMYLAPRKFWPYHLVPAQIGAGGVLVLVAARTVWRRAFSGQADPGSSWLRSDSDLLLLLILLATVLATSRSKTFVLSTAVMAGYTGVLCLGREWFRAAFGKLHMPWQAAALLVFPIAVAGFSGSRVAILSPKFDPAETPIGQMIVDQTREEDAVLFLTTSTWPAALLLPLNRTQGSRYLVPAPLAFFNHYRRTDPATGMFPYPARHEVGGEEGRFLRELGEDIESHDPALIFVRHGPAQALPEGFDIFEYLDHVGFFDQEMADYAPGDVVDDYQVFARR